MTSTKRSSAGLAPGAEQRSVNTCKAGYNQYNTKDPKKQGLFRSEHICRLYSATGKICKDRLPDTLPGQACCHDCTNTSCKRRCRNSKDKCGQTMLCRKIHYLPFMHIEEVL